MFEELFTIGWWIGTIITSLIEGFFLWLSVKIVGGSSTFLKAVLFTFLIQFVGLGLNVLIKIGVGYFFPINDLMFWLIYFGIHLIVWIIIAMQFFKVGIVKAIFIGILQIIIGVVLIVFGVLLMILVLIGLGSLL
ncbi:MAG: hypothetical protein QXO27_04300 [Candidatus Aenigmatarchaeota archaeon]